MISDKLFSIILGVFFLPVLFCVIFIGSKMNYNEGLKLETLRSNLTLFLVAVPVMLITVYLFRRSAGHPLDRKSNMIVNAALLVLFVLVYFVNVRIAREIAFKLPWDILVVSSYARKAAESVPFGYESYFSIYSNNIAITYILGRLLHYAKESIDYSYNPEFIWVQVNCILMAIGGFFSCLTVKRLTRNIMAVTAAFFMNLFLVELSSWKLAPYTDTYGQIFPVICIYFYICCKQAKAVWQRFLLMVPTVLAGGTGGFIKPNLFLVLIAILVVECLYFFADIKGQWKYLLAEILLVIAVLIAAKGYKNHMISEIGLDFNANVEAGMAEYFYMGLNEENTGSYNSGDAAVYGEFQFTERAEREKIVFARALERIKDRGFAGTLDFWLRKMVMTFNDGLFGWKCEVWISEYYEPGVASDTELTSLLRGIYWDGPYVGANNTFMQLVWIYCLLGIPGICLGKRKGECHSILAVCFLGIFFYQMLFEARARYLFAFLPLILAASVYGIQQYSMAAAGLPERLKKRILLQRNQKNKKK